MAKPHSHMPSEETARALLQAVAPGSTLYAIHLLPGSYSNWTYLIEADDDAGTRTRLVFRRYAPSGGGCAAKARREYSVLDWLHGYGLPVPQPLYLDTDGALMGSPGIVTGYVPGQQIMSPPNPSRWARALAAMLARIHSIPCDEAAQRTLMDANTEAVWFLRSGTVPTYMGADPDGEKVWHTVRDVRPHIRHVPTALVHLDYWPGNILWERGRIAAVIDWEEAAYGDPAIDVAYCEMNLLLSGLRAAAEVFLDAYQAARGPVLNLGFWELAAAARPMIHPEEWEIMEPPKRDPFRQFIADAIDKSGR